MFLAGAPPVAEVLGRFKKARHALEVRQRGSSASFIARRYSSSRVRRSSRRVVLERVFANQDLAGRGAGGGAVVWEVRALWKEEKSE